MLLGGMLLLALCSCKSVQPGDMYDGYYTAEAVEYDEQGWKEFITIYVNSNRITTVEYDAKNESGFLKSWDMDYMRCMRAETGTYPKEYVRQFSADLLNKQNTSGMFSPPGAERYHESFLLLAESAIGQAKTGNKDVVFVDILYTKD